MAIREVLHERGSEINPHPEMIRSRQLAWLGVGAALLSMLTTRSVALQFICLTLGAILFIMSAQRLPADTGSKGLPSRTTLVVLLGIAAASFVLRFVLLLAVSTPTRYADYMPETGPPATQFIAANTTFFYLFSVLMMFGASIGAALALFGRKQRTA
ncbi:hypothetical protein [Glutamicibacter protophormiae]|uniref:hypothetical protein n=2 Tax=Glutamicibacter protophormiae TaxID=37930 RepID=UPI00195C39F2|nr:hypothetical protein [Glutamicibacter protophormiae]QRQ80161.1 hypothetical protein JQN66_08235 [Glutamicibacter protophormiae]